MKNTNIRRYSELKKLRTFKERFDYLKLNGSVGVETFGFDRILNQMLYQKDPRWKKARDKVIMRDNGCDLGMEDREIYGKIIVHHMNPIDEEDILNNEDYIFDPEYLISTSINTHNAIHYSDESILPQNPIERSPNDTCPWKR